MDDDRTRKTLDALADLFLTGPSPASGNGGNGAAPTLAAAGGVWRPVRVPPRPAQAKSPDMKTPAAAAPAATTPAKGAGLREQLDAPATLQMPRPVKLAPSLRRSRQDAPPSPPAAAPGRPLRLHIDEPVAAATVEPPRAVAADLRVEAVLLGNLPGFGGPWLTQYAHHVAQQRGPVVLLHVDDEQIEAELITTAPSSAADVPVEAADDLVGLLAELAWRGTSSARTILVHLASPVSSEGLAMLRDLSCWTVLSGADDTAVVAAYRLIKQSLEESENASRRQIALMVMGSDESRARAVEKKLAAAVSGFLRRPIELAGWRKQMGPVHLRQLAAFARPTEVWPNLREFFDELQSASGPLPEASSPRSEEGDSHTAGDEPGEETHDPFEAQEPVPMIDQEPQVAASRDLHESESATTPPLPPPQPSPKGRGGQPAPPSVASDVPDLASFLTSIPGGVALQARCPRQPDTQLVLDQDGRLHLLRQHVGDETQLRAAVLDLIDARGWVREHVELLRLTQRQCRFDPAAEPVLHLFTDQGRIATALAARLGSFLKLHLLQVVRVGDAGTWFCTELN